MFQRKADRRVCHVVHFRAICVDIYHVGHSYVFALSILITFTCLGPVYSIDEIIHNIYRPTSAEANNFQSQILKRRDLSGDLKSSEISISVAVRRWNYQDFLSAWQELLRFLVPGRTEKIVGSWFA